MTNAPIPLSVRTRAMTLFSGGKVISPRGHLWKVDPEDGSLDWYAYDYDPHSGLLCLLCLLVPLSLSAIAGRVRSAELLPSSVNK